MPLEPPDPASSTAEGSSQGPSEPRATTFGEVLRAATPVVWVTPTIVVANVVVYIAMVATGVSPLDPTAADLFKWGASFGPATAYDHQWWRLLTSAFVHVGALHLGLNMYVFSQSGPLVERLYGNVAFLSLYVLAALGGSLAATLWSPLAVSAGASGAVFGVYGALFAFTRKGAHGLPAEVAAGLRKGVLSFVVLNVLFGLTVANISNSAHLGGLATGFAAGWLLARPLLAPSDAPRRRYLRLVALLPALAALGVAAYHRVAHLPLVRASRLASDASTAIGVKDWDRARRLLDEAIALEPDEGRHYLARGHVRERTHDRAGAVADYSEAVSRDPKAPTPLARRCLALYYGGELDRAVADCDAALAVDGAHAEAWHGRAEILSAQGQEDAAFQAARRAADLSPEWPHVRLLAARLAIARGDLAAAEDEIQNASSRTPDEQEVATTRSDLLLRRGEHARAREEAERAVTLDPTEPWGYLQRASVSRAKGDFEQALADNDRALALDANDVSVRNARAWTLLQLGRPADARAEVERVLELEPRSPHALGTRCWIRASLGDGANARPDCALATKRWPAARADRGMLAFLDGHYEDAAAIWKTESVRVPEDAPYLGAWIAKAERMRGRR